MEKQWTEESNIEPPWIPHTPMKSISTVEEQACRNQVDESKFVVNKDMSALSHLSFGDLLALANTASLCFSGQTPKPINNTEAMESLSSVRNNVTEQNTPEKQKKKKHRPKVVRERKPKRGSTSRKSVVAEGQERKTPKRKYVRKEVKVNKDQDSNPVELSASVETPTPAKKLCRRSLDFDTEIQEKQSNSDAKQADEIQSAPLEKQLDSGNQEPKDCLLSEPSTPKRKNSQGKRKEKEPKISGNNLEESDILISQAAKRRQGKEPTSCDMNLSGIQYNELHDYQKMHGLYFPNFQQEGMRSVATCRKSFGRQEFKDVSAFASNCYSFTSQVRGNRVLTTEEKREDIFQRSQHFEKSQSKQKTILPNVCQSGISPDELWKQLYSVEALSQELRLLDINWNDSENALVPYSMKSQENQIVLFGGGSGAIVPVTPVKKRRPRPKVDLDNETEKVWNLLLENINSEGIDGSDEQKAKWWEEERNVFRGRADSFIARMHLVQGDRRFTPWKGSVVDSVVGVFLTQNVSDHLSSSAFMSLAAEFPVPSVPSSDFGVGTSSMSSIQITYLDSEESNPPDHNQSSVILKSAQPDEGKDYLNSTETSRSSSEIASSAHESVGKTTDAKTYVDSEQKGLILDVDKTDQKRFVLDLFPSEDSALTCQHSMVSDTRNAERERSSSDIILEEEYRTSYMKLLQGVQVSLEESNQKNRYHNSRQEVGASSNPGSLQVSPNMSPGDCSSEVKDLQSPNKPTKTSDDSNELCCCYGKDGHVLSCLKPEMPESSSSVGSTKHKEKLVTKTLIPDINESTSCPDVHEGTEKLPGPDTRQYRDTSCKEISPTDDDATLNAKGKKVLKEIKENFDWDSLRR